VTVEEVGPPIGVEPLLAAAQVRWDPALSREIALRLFAPDRLRPVSITELLDPRPGFFRIYHPLPASEEREARLELGRSLHERAEQVVSPSGRREARLAREGIVGRVDLLADRPIEIKSTGSAWPTASELPNARPQYLEQLGMYCALLDRPEGRLVLLRSHGEGVPEIAVVEATFGDLPATRERMRERAEEYRTAITARDPTGLPRCGWFDRGCEYQSAGVCPCHGDERPMEPIAIGTVGTLANAPIEAAEIRSRWESAVAAPGFQFRTYSEAVYPRRTFYERTVELPPGSPTRWVPPVAPGGDAQRSMFLQLRDLLDMEFASEVEERTPPGDLPAEGVLLFRREPWLLKTSRVRAPPDPAELGRKHPTYLIELGLRCAALGRPAGYLCVGYERVAPEAGPVRIYRVEFGTNGAWRNLLEQRRRAIEASIRAGRPFELTPCPDYMFEGCPYRAYCGEGGVAPAAARLQE
jgi:hypothetical protein